MADFYDQWLKFWDEEEEQRAKAKKVIHEEELQWVKNKQDHKVALLAAPETGFYTQGGVTMVAEIPEGCKTGKHSHGEEVMYIIEGEGCTVLDGQRYEWETGSTLFMPFGGVHRHFNTGKGAVRYFSAHAIHLERFVGLAKLVQYEDASKIAVGEPKEPKASSDISTEKAGRIVLRLKDAPQRFATPEEKKSGRHFHARRVDLMGFPGVGFNATEVEITTIMCDEPQEHPEKHAHMEAHVYILKGEGHSIVDGVKIPWKKGSLIHVQGPVTMHQHFNTGKTESQMLRVHFGMRSYFFEKIAQRTFLRLGETFADIMARGNIRYS